MNQKIAMIALVVKDYDEAIEFYTQKLDFKLLEDTRLSEEKRWVVVAPPGQNECRLLLARAANEEQAASIGNRPLAESHVSGRYTSASAPLSVAGYCSTSVWQTL